MKILLLDIETAPNKAYTWGLWKQNIALNQVEEFGYTLCWAAKWYGEKKMMFASIHANGKKKMLEEVYKLLDEADVVIHYNGVKFDIPILNQEFLSLGFTPPSPIIQIDLLRVVRKQFRLTSNKLDYVARYLGFGGKFQHKGMELWTECMAGDEASWKIMEKYNKQDVTLLEQVYKLLLPWISNHPNYGLFLKADRPTCPNCGSSHIIKRGVRYTQSLTYPRYLCKNCGSWSKGRYTDYDKDKRKNVLKGI